MQCVMSEFGNRRTKDQVQTAMLVSLLQVQSEIHWCSDGTDPVTAAAVKPKRRSMWKRTKDVEGPVLQSLNQG